MSNHEAGRRRKILLGMVEVRKEEQEGGMVEFGAFETLEPIQFCVYSPVVVVARVTGHPDKCYLGTVWRKIRACGKRGASHVELDVVGELLRGSTSIWYYSSQRGENWIEAKECIPDNGNDDELNAMRRPDNDMDIMEPDTAKKGVGENLTQNPLPALPIHPNQIMDLSQKKGVLEEVYERLLYEINHDFLPRSSREFV
ncbi:hypothetical protein C8R42DRAFT_648521 [Lentinula raphanica]|nr:hypothetical protein C8R42DRAFT_648521 [Lentinula raphanica]